MKVQFRPAELRLKQVRVTVAEENLGKVFPESVYKSKLGKFPRALAGEILEYETVREKQIMKTAADSHDTARVAIFRRVKLILRAEKDRQAILWKELLDGLLIQRQGILRVIKNRKRRQRKLQYLEMTELEYIDEQIRLVESKQFEVAFIE